MYETCGTPLELFGKSQFYCVLEKNSALSCITTIIHNYQTSYWSRQYISISILSERTLFVRVDFLNENNSRITLKEQNQWKQVANSVRFLTPSKYRQSELMRINRHTHLFCYVEMPQVIKDFVWKLQTNNGIIIHQLCTRSNVLPRDYRLFFTAIWSLVVGFWRDALLSSLRIPS